MLPFELLQIALQHRTTLSYAPTEEQWRDLYDVFRKQALLGITFAVIERLPNDQRPPKSLLLQWGLSANRIQVQNDAQQQKIIAIVQKFKAEGFRSLVLKGQGIAQYYQVDALNRYRVPGDLDIWLEGSRHAITTYARRQMSDCAIVYHHVECPRIDGVDVEIHYTPSWMNNFFTNRTLQRYFNEQKRLLFDVGDRENNAIPSPTLAFNRVYILIHIYRHLFHTGVGLRQLLDYYYVLRQGFTEDEQVEAMRVISSLKMERFAKAIMWVLQKVFCLDKQYMLIAPDEKEGQFLLDEIMKAGNFGQYDNRILRRHNESAFLYGMRKVKRNFRFVRSYPSEVLWSPIFKLWHFVWRMMMHWQYRGNKNN